MRRILLLFFLAAEWTVAQTSEWDFLRQPFVQLSETQRVQLIEAGLTRNTWLAMGDALVAGLDPGPLYGDLNKPKLIERLRLAQVFLWLGTGWQEGLRWARNGKAAPAGDVRRLQGALSLDQWRSVLRNRDLVNALGETVVPEDNLAGVFQVLGDLAAQNPEGVAEFPDLAVAYAVVYDQKPALGWPPVGADAYRHAPLRESYWQQSFAYFAEQSRRHKLSCNIRALRADELKFVVDASLDVKEYLWVQKNVRIARDDVGEAFFMVKYDEWRITRNGGEDRPVSWKYPEYTLQMLREKGGICVDQAYFAWVVGKARGVPTIFFVGSGSEGGHAWVGFLQRDNKWSVDSGRYASQRYVTGVAIDPQTWQPITDHQLQLISSRMTTTPRYINSALLLTLAQLLPESAAAQKMALLRNARQQCPGNTQLWFLQEQRLLAEGDPKATRTFYEDMARQFKNTPDLCSYAQKQMAAASRQSGNTATAEAIEKKVVSRNRNDRADISVATTRDMVLGKIEGDDAEEGLKMFRTAVRKFKQDTGIVVRDLVQPVVMAFHRAGRPELVAKAMDTACKELTPSEYGSIEDELQDLADRVDVRLKSRVQNKFGSRILKVDSRGE